MKTTSFNTIFALLIVAFFSISSSTFAQHNKPQRNNPHHQPKGLQRADALSKPSMIQAQKVLKRTHFVILKAHHAVKLNKVYTGDLARAVAHQKFAKKMFAMKNPHKAILHSREARRYAFKVLEANKAQKDVEQSYQFDKEETGLVGIEDKSLNLEKEIPETSFDDKVITEKEMSELEVKETPPSEYKNEK